MSYWAEGAFGLSALRERQDEATNFAMPMKKPEHLPELDAADSALVEGVLALGQRALTPAPMRAAARPAGR